MMIESRNFYDNLGLASREWLVSRVEQGGDYVRIKKEIKLHARLNPSIDDLKETVVMAYIDFGEAERALDLACDFRDAKPNANMHNLVLKALLSSWRYTKRLFLDESLSWAALYAKATPGNISPYHNSRVRVGFVCDYGSSIFGENAIFPMCAGLALAGLDVVYYNFETVSFAVETDCFRVENVANMSVAALSRKIVDDRIDVLVDLNGRLRSSHRLGIFTMRSAPVQFNYFNLVGTSGIKTFDYIIADDVQIPKEDETFFTEKILRLPCGVNGAYAFKRDIPLSLSTDISERPLTFASFNAFFKYNSLLLQDWAAILLKVPNSRLLIKCKEMEGERVPRKIAENFARAGVDLSRIMVQGWSSLEELRALYSTVDLCLDTYPYSGGSSTLNALWQGVPVLTFCGDGWRARTSASMLNAAGLDAMVATSRQEYIEKAVYFANHREELTAIRHQLSTHVMDNHYFNPGLVYSELADCFKGVVAQLAD